jgi:predicted nuclease of predicted toxin-antitoxin system
MEFKVDENLPVEVADLLRQVGYDAVTVFEQHLEGSPDSDIASVCHEEGRALITLDTDFADIRAYPPAQFPGLIVLRLHRQDKPHVLEVIGRLIPPLSSEPLEHLLWIVEETRLRIRG